MVYFRKAGDYGKQVKHAQPVFFRSEQRMRSLNEAVFHRNDYNSEWRIPDDFFREHFRYEHSTGIYRTDLHYCDIVQFLTVEKL